MAIDYKPTNCPNCKSNLLIFIKLLFGGVSNNFKCRACDLKGFWTDLQGKEKELDKFLSDKEMRRLVEYALIGWKKNPTFSEEDSKLMEKVGNWIK